jgi:choline dehydrogenase
VRVALAGVGENLRDHPGVDVECGSVVAQGPPALHSVATFHSSMTAADGAPDLLFWVSDPEPSDEPTFTIDVVLLEPRSRGSVRLRSADPAEPPRIDLPGVREGADVERLVEGYRRGWEIADRPEVRRLCAGPLPAVDDAHALAREIRRNAYSVPHVVGTCAMGPSPDDGAVVDPTCRVHGTSQLFVADASVIPIPPSGFPHLPTIMVGERFAEQLAATR